MPEYRHGRSGSLNIPNGSAGLGHGHGHGNSHAQGHAQGPAHGPAHGHAHGHSHGQMMPRSPPNTSHVPCKFFRQGACQAGNACPFSHDIGTSTETVCKYFAKGNCKFGPKCANIHVLPDGRRINYGKNGVTIGATPINLLRRPSPGPASPTSASASATASASASAAAAAAFHHESASALTSSLFHADQPPFPSGYADDCPQRFGHQPNLDGPIPAIDMPYPTSSYGSPRDEDPARLGFGLSPVNGKGLSVLDAPLPASFDSNGISHAARFPSAPWPSSVPSKFGFESPTPSLSNAKDSRASETLRLLHTSAFGPAPMAGSPPNSHTLDGEEYFGKRAMHSSRHTRPRMLSFSLPKTSVDRDWGDEFAFGDDGDNVPENYVPENLQDLLTPAEKARRGSMRAEDPVVEGISKYGSPMGASPSRWGSLFQRQKEDEDAARAARSAASAFGHVGSPLRKSTLAQEMGDDPKAGPNGGSRPPAMRPGSEPMSVLSQQLQRSRLEDAVGGPGPLLHPNASRISAGGLGATARDRAMERHVSSGSIGSSVTGRFTTPIDEEDPAFVFSMEEDDPGNGKARKRASAGLAMAGGFPSYAGAAAGGRGGGGGGGGGGGAVSTSKDSRDSVPVNGR